MRPGPRPKSSAPMAADREDSACADKRCTGIGKRSHSLRPLAARPDRRALRPYGPIDGESFKACIEQFLVPTLSPVTLSSWTIRSQDTREKVIAFQEEYYRILYQHFSGDRDRLAEANEADSFSLRLVSECRHIWGSRSAAELWAKRGLPKSHQWTTSSGSRTFLKGQR